MNLNYYGPTREAEGEVNRLLGLPATGDEQDWEIELADPEKLDIMMDALESEPLSSDAKTALCLLILASFECGFETGQQDASRRGRAIALLHRDENVLAMMRFYWFELGFTHHPTEMRTLLK